MLEYGNFWLASARLSLGRHYPFPYFFQSRFQQVKRINDLVLTGRRLGLGCKCLSVLVPTKSLCCGCRNRFSGTTQRVNGADAIAQQRLDKVFGKIKFIASLRHRKTLYRSWKRREKKVSVYGITWHWLNYLEPTTPNEVVVKAC